MVSKKIIVLCIAAACAFASDAAEQQPSKPPIAQVWIDLSTVSSNMPNMSSMRPGAMLGNMFGGGSSNNAGGNAFGNTRMMGGSGRWMDVTLTTRNNPSLQNATQAVPDGSKLAPTLALVSPEGTPPPVIPKTQPREEEKEPDPEFKKPKGKILLYWGCGETVRDGQPRVLDMANAAPQDFAGFFQSRHATTKGTHSTPGQPDWPNKTDSRMIPADATLVGQHTFTGDGVPEGFKLNIDEMHDLMPPIDLHDHDTDNATVLDWSAIPSARAYFIASFSSRGEGEMVIWTSSELPDFGMGLIDYQPNGSIDAWLKEKVLLQPSVTECAVPKDALGKHGMLRMIAYGNELNVAYPAPPKNPKQVWEPQWAAKVRLKSVTMNVLGMQNRSAGNNQGNNPNPDPNQPPQPAAPTPINVLKGLFGH